MTQLKSKMAVRSALEAQLAPFGGRLEPWFVPAAMAAQGVRRTTRGGHHVYVLACDGFGEDGTEMGIYVGRSRYLPETRFAQHLSGLAEKHAARWFRLDRPGRKRRPLVLLPVFHTHLNPMTKAEAEEREVEMVHALLNAGVPKSQVGGPRSLSKKSRPRGEGNGTSGDTSRGAT